jgi:hypothetical protein
MNGEIEKGTERRCAMVMKVRYVNDTTQRMTERQQKKSLEQSGVPAACGARFPLSAGPRAHIPGQELLVQPMLASASANRHEV